MAYVGENLAQWTKQLIIKELQYYFQYVSDFGGKSVPGQVHPIKTPEIREAYGLEIREYPIIIIKILHEETRSLGIGKDFVQDVYSDDQAVGQQYLPGTENFINPVPYKPRVIAERKGYMADITFNIQIWGDTTQVRNRLSDEVDAAIRFYQRQSLLNQGVVLSRLTSGEETDFPLSPSEKIFISNLNLIVNVERYFDHIVNSITKLNYYTFKTFLPLKAHTDPTIVEDENNAP